MFLVQKKGYSIVSSLWNLSIMCNHAVDFCRRFGVNTGTYIGQKRNFRPSNVIYFLIVHYRLVPKMKHMDSAVIMI